LLTYILHKLFERTSREYETQVEIILTVDSIVKNFGKIKAVDDLSFNIEKGEIFALLGPNGAGKTTTVRMLMNIIKPDEGKIKFNLNRQLNTHVHTSPKLGYLPEERGLYQEIPILKTLEFMGIIRGMNKSSSRKAACEWLDKLELSERKNEKLSALSKGNQQKIQFIAAVIHNPEFVILDEPFAGFDPINQEAFLMIIKELREKGTTILLSAHQMHLVEKIADKVLLMNNGKSIAYGTIDEIKKESSVGEKLTLSVSGQPDLTLLQNDDVVEKLDFNNKGELELLLKQNKSLSGLLGKAASSLVINSVKSEHITLHDIFIEKVNKAREGKNE